MNCNLNEILVLLIIDHVANVLRMPSTPADGRFADLGHGRDQRERGKSLIFQFYRKVETLILE